jgi:HSP20 family protein
MNTEAFESINIYPGKFVPARDEEKIKEQLRKSDDDCLTHPCVNIKESIDSYEVQVSAPGLQREEFIVYGNDNSLLVDASTRKSFITGMDKNMHHNINMPANADTELTVAEYKNSVLYLYVPKTKLYEKHVSARIVVY